MTKPGRMAFGLTAAAGAAVLVSALSAQQAPAGGGALRGVVNGAAGPEAGVWVIAETDDLDTRFRKIVVTGDDGRFLVPDLPAADFRVWVRGYGLVDSDPVTARPGRTLTLRAAAAASPREAAQVYPANYWYSLLEPPPPSQFPGTGPDGNGIARRAPQPGRLGRRHQAGLPALPSDGQPLHARHQPPRAVRLGARGVGTPPAVRAARRADEPCPRSFRPRARSGDVRGLERADCRRRGAAAAAPSAGRRAQRGADHVGMG